MQKNIFPEDFFSTPNQYKTIQNPIDKNREHPKIINPTLLKSKSNQPLIVEIKEEKCEESIDVPKNKNSLKIIIPKNVSIEEISTSGGSYNTPKTPNIPINQVIKVETEPNKNKKNGFNIKDKLISNNALNKNIKKNNNKNNIKDENIDLYYPMAFTFNAKGKKNRTLNNTRRMNYKYNKSFDKNIKNNNEVKEKKDKIVNDKKRKTLSCQRNKEEKLKKENINININKNTKNISYDKIKYKNENNKNIIRNNIRNNSQREDKKNSRNNFSPSNDRKARSAKKNKETINLITINNNRNILRRNCKEDKKDLYNKTNLKTLKFDYDKKKKEIVHLKVKNEINQIFEKLPENYEKNPILNNKFELFMKNLEDIKYVLDRNNSKNFFPKTKGKKK